MKLFTWYEFDEISGKTVLLFPTSMNFNTFFENDFAAGFSFYKESKWHYEKGTNKIYNCNPKKIKEVDIQNYNFPRHFFQFCIIDIFNMSIEDLNSMFK